MPILAEQLVRLQKEFELTLTGAVDHCKTTCPEIIARPDVIAEFARMEAAGYKVRRPCHELGLCKGRHGEHWQDILAIHSCLQRALDNMVSNDALRSGDTLLILQGSTNGHIYIMYRLVAFHWFKKPTFSVTVPCNAGHLPYGLQQRFLHFERADARASEDLQAYTSQLSS